MRSRALFLFFPFLFLLGSNELLGQSNCQDCIRINEFQIAPEVGPNGDPDNTGEFLELFNRCDQPVDIGCMRLCMLTSSFCGECVQIPAGTVLPPGDVFTMGGYGTNCSGGGVTNCDFPGLTLDLNWHDCGCVNDPDAGVSCGSANAGMHWGVLVDSGEDIYLFDENDDLVQGLRYLGGAGYTSGDCPGGGSLNLSGCNGCGSSSVTPPNAASLPDIGGSGSTIGYVNDCSGGFTSVSDTAALDPGVAECSGLISPPCCTTDIAFSYDTLSCAQPVVTLDASASSTYSGNTEWSWSTSGGNIVGAAPDSSSIDLDQAGTYELIVTDIDNGCSEDTTISVPGNTPVPNASILPPDTITCSKAQVTLDATGSATSSGNIEWHWSTGNGNIVGAAPDSSTVEVDEGGDYTLTVRDPDNGCETDTTVSVINSSGLDVQLSASDTMLCEGNSASLTATGSGGTSPYTYHWDQGLGSGKTHTVSPTSTTVYEVYVEDANGCSSDPASIEVSVNPLPDVGIDGTELTGCAPLEAKLVNTTDPSEVGGDQLWDLGDGTLKAGMDSLQHEYSEPGCYDVSLSVRSPEGCVDSTKEVNMICVYERPVADFEADPEEVTVQDPETDFTNMSMGAEEYEWDFGGLDSSTQRDPTYSFPQEKGGSYEVCLTAANSYGCRDSSCQDIGVRGGFLLYVPNAFTPDGDGVNELFKPVVQGADRSSYAFRIYDRWGEKVFETRDPDEGWDGSIDGGSGSPKPDVYVWRLVTENAYTGESIERTGHVTLIR